MDKEIKPIRITASVLDDTFYVIEYATSENAKETAYDKDKTADYERTDNFGKQGLLRLKFT